VAWRQQPHRSDCEVHRWSDILHAELFESTHYDESSPTQRFYDLNQGTWEGCLHVTALLTTLVPATKQWWY
jgi:hypothetical protein